MIYVQMSFADILHRSAERFRDRDAAFPGAVPVEIGLDKERVRKEYEEKLAAAQNGGDGRQVYKFLIENAMQSVARVKSFLKQHPDYAADKEKDFLDLISQNFFTVLEAMQDG